MQTWDGVLIKSSNIGMGKVGERVGNQRMSRVLAAWGFGTRPGCGLQGESAGMVNPLPRWTPYSITSIPMGQEVAVTPLQITRAFCAFANGGRLVHPTIRALDDPAQPGQAQFVGRILSPEVAMHTRGVLRRAVVEGTGKKADSKLYAIFGKTGTAQMPGAHGGYAQGAYIGSFTAGAPFADPAVVVGCFIQRPDPSKGYYGGIISAPAVKNVIEKVLAYRGVMPDAMPDSGRGPAGPLDARE
jgi:cell division protein FtsI/penicillin-binding protein 2